MPILDIRGLKAYYITRKYGHASRVRAVDGVSFQVKKDEIYGIAGESGCGKSTLLKAVSGLIKPPLQVLEGEVVYDFEDQKLSILSLREDRQRRRIRGVRISLIPQGSMSVLNPVRRIRESFRDIIDAHLGTVDEARFNDIVRTHLDALGLDWSVMHAFPHQLSGGMRQRITIALATILKPDIVFADEPTTALDVVVQRGVIQLIKKIKREQMNTVIMVTHDLAVHANLCDRLAIMYAGKMVEEADVDALFSNPRHPYTIVLLKSLPRLGDRSVRTSAPGAPPSLVNVPSGCRFHPRCPEAMERCRSEDPELVEVEKGHRVACLLEEGSR
ncbi:MAG: ABC transporter ATP-binding protein [Firmicutes bacterium]|jgi:peptide/nickel transport system ATP-binding protein|nr:ABC transporter ATP-binding protein [Bacillota bacterium]